LSAKIVPTFTGQRVLGGQHNESPRPLISVFYTGAAISLKWLLKYPYEAEWTLFQTHYFSENLIEPGIEPGPLDL
jgi:hypothetical protein